MAEGASEPRFESETLYHLSVSGAPSRPKPDQTFCLLMSGTYLPNFAAVSLPVVRMLTVSISTAPDDENPQAELYGHYGRGKSAEFFRFPHSLDVGDLICFNFRWRCDDLRWNEVTFNQEN